MYLQVREVDFYTIILRENYPEPVSTNLASLTERLLSYGLRPLFIYNVEADLKEVVCERVERNGILSQYSIGMSYYV